MPFFAGRVRARSVSISRALPILHPSRRRIACPAAQTIRRKPRDLRTMWEPWRGGWRPVDRWVGHMQLAGCSSGVGASLVREQGNDPFPYMGTRAASLPSAHPTASCRRTPSGLRRSTQARPGRSVTRTVATLLKPTGRRSANSAPTALRLPGTAAAIAMRPGLKAACARVGHLTALCRPVRATIKYNPRVRGQSRDDRGRLARLSNNMTNETFPCSKVSRFVALCRASAGQSVGFWAFSGWGRSRRELRPKSSRKRLVVP